MGVRENKASRIEARKKRAQIRKQIAAKTLNNLLGIGGGIGNGNRNGGGMIFSEEAFLEQTSRKYGGLPIVFGVELRSVKQNWSGMKYRFINEEDTRGQIMLARGTTAACTTSNVQLRDLEASMHCLRLRIKNARREELTDQGIKSLQDEKEELDI